MSGHSPNPNPKWYLLACKPAYGRHMLGWQPSAFGWHQGPLGLSSEFCDGTNHDTPPIIFRFQNHISTKLLLLFTERTSRLWTPSPPCDWLNSATLTTKHKHGSGGHNVSSGSRVSSHLMVTFYWSTLRLAWKTIFVYACNRKRCRKGTHIEILNYRFNYPNSLYSSLVRAYVYFCPGDSCPQQIRFN